MKCTVLFCSEEKSELNRARSKTEAVVVNLLNGKLNDVIIVYSSSLFLFN